ncbi:hypothetical protein CARUB_v10012784mg [Capsella rubella]|uniref:Ubiquitin-like protease family profile domain-containing protein n=1 Tax=Capsella rubella TaxID=81985 RepID=R0GIS7_9BRAS|nr:hypothetical protein CARUB_v10012784mg [Capsella rubella]
MNRCFRKRTLMKLNSVLMEQAFHLNKGESQINMQKTHDMEAPLTLPPEITEDDAPAPPQTEVINSEPHISQETRVPDTGVDEIFSSQSRTLVIFEVSGEVSEDTESEERTEGDDNESEEGTAGDESDKEHIDVSDSSPARPRERGVLSVFEVELMCLVLNTRTPSISYQPDLLPRVDREVLKSFMKTLKAVPNTRHEQVLSIERSRVLSPWLANYLQGKYKTFSVAKIKTRVRWDDQLQRSLNGSPSQWFDLWDMLYIPMIWGDSHWVGLAISLPNWSIDILDPNVLLNSDSNVGNYMAPVVEMLPYIIHKFCNPPCDSKSWLSTFQVVSPKRCLCQ